jgi:hypothetical protein
VAVAKSTRSFCHAQLPYDVGYYLQLWQCDTPKCRVYHASSVVRPPMLTSPPQPSSTADVAPHDTRDHWAASPLPHTKPVAHALTKKTYVTNQSEICPKPAQEDNADGSISSMLGPFHDDLASLPMFHCLIAQTNSTLSVLSQESNSVAPLNISNAFSSSFHKPFSCQALLLSFKPHQEIPRGHQSPPNCTILYAADKDMSPVINRKYKGQLKLCQYELTHASSSPTTLPQK